MSDAPPPPPPASPPPPPQAGGTPAPGKKGLSPLAWIAIGCGGILLVAGVVVTLGLGWLFNKGSEYVKEIEAEPAMVAAETLVRLNPELELVESDSDAGTLTIREKDTGKELTIDIAELQQGRIRFDSEEGEGTVEIGGQEGVLRVENEKGETFEIGSGEIPAWVPSYPGQSSEPTVLFSRRDAAGLHGAIDFETEDEPAAVLDFYVRELESAGYEVERTDLTGSLGNGGLLTARNEPEGRRLDINVRVGGRDGASSCSVSYQERFGDAE